MSQEMTKETVKHEETNRFTCPGCGANMTFNPQSNTLFCEYCQNSIEILNPQGDIEEYDFSTAENLDSSNWGLEKRVIKCESCGAKTVLDTYSTAQFCAFCGSSHIVREDESAGIAPESLIPFSVPLDKSSELFKKWIKGKFFAPKEVKNNTQIKKMSGIYIPCWTYDTDTSSTYAGEGGTYYYVTRTDWVTRNGKRQQVTRQERRIRWWPTSGVYSQYFDDVLVNASKNADPKLMKKLEPFHMNALVHYKPEYLSGFLAERYSIDLKEGWETAKKTVKSGIHSGVVKQINADEVRNLRINTNYNSIKYKHILLPVWICAYTFKNKIYKYMVNGQTGEVQGNAPVSPWKVVLVVLGSLAALGGLLLAFTQFG